MSSRQIFAETSIVVFVGLKVPIGLVQSIDSISQTTWWNSYTIGYSPTIASIEMYLWLLHISWSSIWQSLMFSGRKIKKAVSACHLFQRSYFLNCIHSWLGVFGYYLCQTIPVSTTSSDMFIVHCSWLEPKAPSFPFWVPPFRDGLASFKSKT